MPSPIRTTASPVRFLIAAACVAAGLASGVLASGSVLAADSLESSGVALIPDDVAFVSATLRLREQYDRLVSSNAWAAIRKLPFFVRAAEAVEEQKLQPGSPLSMLSTFLELPENEQAVSLLQDMVATDSFVYGESSWVPVAQLMKRLQQAQNAAGFLQMASGEASVGGIEVDMLDGIELNQDDGRAGRDDDLGPRPPKFLPVRLQAEAAEKLSAEELGQRLTIRTLAENAELIVVPDIVWGFKIGKREAADFQLRRIEVLVKGITQLNPAFAESLARRKVAGGEMVTFTIKADPALVRTLPLGAGLESVQKDVDTIFERLEKLQLVIGIGVIGDRVIISIGDSIDHLEKLARPADGRKGLLATKPFAPLLAHKEKPITGISYVSEAMKKAMAPAASDIEELAGLSDTIADLADLPDGAAEEARRILAKVAESYGSRLPVPGPSMSFAFFSEQGYEGYDWDWTRNLPFDGSKRLEILEHTGGAPLAAAAFRVKQDPAQFEDFVSWADMGWSFFRKYLLPKADDDVQEKFAEVDEHFSPLARRLVGILRTKILPALADGQIAFVIDGKSSTKRLHAALPAAAEPLPLVEPAIVLGLADPKLYKEGLNDLFGLADDLVDAVREIAPDSVPAEYRVPEPAKNKVEAGTVWSFSLGRSGLDEKVQPAIAVGDDVAVLSLVPKQAGRLLLESRLDTGSQLSKFDEPLARGATLDFAGLVDLIQPWVVYFVRYGCVQQREGVVDPETDLGPDDETDQARDALVQSKTFFEAIKSLRAAVAETSVKSDALVTHWRNIIRDIPAK